LLRSEAVLLIEGDAGYAGRLVRDERDARIGAKRHSVYLESDDLLFLRVEGVGDVARLEFGCYIHDEWVLRVTQYCDDNQASGDGCALCPLGERELALGGEDVKQSFHISLHNSVYKGNRCWVSSPSSGGTSRSQGFPAGSNGSWNRCTSCHFLLFI
jgi:hypothetical protein